MKNTNDSATEVYKLALQSAPSGVLVVDAKGYIRYANQTLAEMFGYDIEELLDGPVEVLIPEQFAAAHRHHVVKFAEGRQPREMGSGRDLEGIGKDGRRFPVEIGLRPAETSSGRVVVATVIDISGRKAIEERLRRHEEELEQLVAERTRELEISQQEKERMLEQLIQVEKMTTVGTLVSGIGHEINNPLYVLHAAAEALIEESDIDQCHSLGEEILRQAGRIAETVKNLSRYAQPAARHDLQHVDLGEVIVDAVQLARQSPGGHQVDFVIFDSEVPPVLARFEEILQVILNLLRNAIQAMPGKGRIEIDSALENNAVRLRIQDNGKGIPGEFLKRVFDPFFTTKGPDQGEGLGLYIVRQIVTRYDGTISVDNVNSGGTRFEIRLPVAEQTKGRTNDETPNIDSR